ncbi:hypothetical protein MTsPCn9_30560 [Croceitalea sp. MTPC9]|uniref:hypothetical protein n=1 Tax=unclassified Croceitalea TaxID=2632280 RepID=UPI002B3C1F97|nr:hypothetical protein MTsPCn6_21090 [Croceitalea sp. MTPC6]GMN18116.1 hypothetical protein MTsPCn9_30560 [Croceitalea sp. MTPC9]
MLDKDIYIGNAKVKSTEKEIIGDIVQFENESYYKISNYDTMRPFFMSIVSNSNHWMFISSNGGLTAGRQNSESSLFPYYTDDKITEMAHITGSKTILQVHSEDKVFLWEPFSDSYAGLYKVFRNLYKNSYGNKVVFEEINEDLGLTYRYQWNSSDAYGFVKKSTLINNNESNIEIIVLDGIQNIMPHGVNSALQNASSNLVDAYKKNELEADIGLGIYALSAIIVDRAEPSEALKATTVWSTGLEDCTYLVCSKQLDAFRKGQTINQEVDIKAEKGAYFLKSDFTLKNSITKSWMMVAEVNQSSSAIAIITNQLKKEKNLSSLVQEDIELGSKQLVQLNAASDAMQFTADKLRNTRHFSNTLFNIMRGGIFDDNYNIGWQDFVRYIRVANRRVYKEKEVVLKNLAKEFTLKELKELAENDNDADFKRLAYEYMPLKFSRRHGDPSRPWNKFSINTVAEDGSKILDYEGNWRDIFQNWEALAHSYPAFVDSMIHKFLNASTFDGYNPYRVTKDGFDWEAIEPDDPWSYIGYWGDHQIIYLLKFLEFIENHYPGKLGSYFNEQIFVYANVPYKIKDYQAILQNPKDTIVFDEELDLKIREERSKLGADGALLKGSDNSIYRVNLLEKLLATVLAKVSNFIPEGGIWMNTQRPEWNDANNALVGNGVSMVTLNYLRRFLNFFQKTVEGAPIENYQISKELITFFNEIRVTLTANLSSLSGALSNEDRKKVMDGLGKAGSVFRETIYDKGFKAKKGKLTKEDILQFVHSALIYLEHSIRANKRNDNLYHAYNLMTVENDTEVSISYLSEMLEGQVAALSSGYLSSKDSLALLDGLKESALFREDQYSYLLYPNKELPRFVEKNNIPAKKVEKSVLVKQLLKDGNIEIIRKDVDGNYHFNGSFNNADSLKNALSNLPKEKYGKLVKEDEPLLLSIFEEIFDHKSFTGRSGTFFGYEGLGSIYWHMVSKLLLAVQETCLRAIELGESEEVIGRLLEHYYEINEGIGVHKSPELYGAFPTDPYSHTPAGKGAQQPGMTGQVKEDILSRFGELGVFVESGKLVFKPYLLRKNEFLEDSSVFEYIARNGEVEKLSLDKGELCFTYCQVPIIYRIADNESLSVFFKDNSRAKFNSLSLDHVTSKKVFDRTGEINKIIVAINK